jgi:hypothetical protein
MMEFQKVMEVLEDIIQEAATLFRMRIGRGKTMNSAMSTVVLGDTTM